MLVLALGDLDHFVEDAFTGKASEPEEQKTWERKDCEARAVITLSLSSENLEHWRMLKLQTICGTLS